MTRTLFDLRVLAPNGKRRGLTTGTCATAAAKAAALKLFHGVDAPEVEVDLPDGMHFVPVRVAAVEHRDGKSAVAQVIKDAGDDPDCTHQATITTELRVADAPGFRFFAGEGVGTITQPGTALEVGEPAINPWPRRMIEHALGEALAGHAPGLDVTVGCKRGEELARRTYNPRLGIVGGISILGTSGIVEPMSLSAYKASIEIYIRVALGDRPGSIAYVPGRLGTRFLQHACSLAPKRVVQISNFLGFALHSLERALCEQSFRLRRLWLVGHPGKLAKVLGGHWNTHSKHSPMAVSAVADVARDVGLRGEVLQAVTSAQSVEAVARAIQGAPARRLWRGVEARIEEVVGREVPTVDEVTVRLFGLNEAALGGAA